MNGDARGVGLDELYHTGLCNKHPLEMIAMTQRHTERLGSNSEIKEKLQEHHAESETTTGDERLAEWIRGQIVPATEPFIQLTRARQRGGL